MLVPIIGLGVAGDARAEKKVDWTPYLEQPGERVKPQKTAEVKPTPAKAKVKPKAQAQAKPKAKRKAKR
jgi:hypothetical protein